MKGLTDYHSHSRFCDGRGELLDYYQAAVKMDMAGLGFSGHAPLPFETVWNMKTTDASAYLARGQEAARLSESTGLRLAIGLEVDYIPDVISPSQPRLAGRKPDYVIGSVHFLGTTKAGMNWTVDGSQEEFETGVAQSYDGDYRSAVSEFYRRIRDLVRTDPPDILGHFDLIKKNNNGLFDEDSDWYRDAVEQTLAQIAASPTIVEINTGGVTRGYREDFYPGPWIVRRLAELGIPVTVSSDSHDPGHLCNHFARVFGDLRETGITTYQVLTDGGWVARPIPGEGDIE